MSPSVADAVKKTDGASIITRVAVGITEMDGRTVVLYATDANDGTSLLVSTQIWRSLGEKRAVTVGGIATTVVGVDARLPANAVSGSFDLWVPAIDSSRRANWLLVVTDRPRLVSDALARMIGASVTDSPNDIVSKANTRGVSVFLLNASLSRFDPFSFRTKFSSLVLNAAMSTIFGWVARFVFLAGIVLAITSALIGVRERRDEIGLLAALGLQAGVTTLLLFESVIICGLSFILGSIVAMIVLAGVLPQAQWLTVMGPSLVMGSTYLIVLLVLTPLVAAQQVAARSAAELVREGTST
jgi:hypothetical protein